MKLKTIRWLDSNIGRAACLVLTMHRRVTAFFAKGERSKQAPLKIVFVKLLEQGSTVLAYAALRQAAKMVGRDNVYFVVFKENRPILDILNVLPSANIIEIDSRSLPAFVRTALKALSKMRRERIDACVDMEFFSRASAVLSYLSGAAARVGLAPFLSKAPYRGDLFTHRLAYNPYMHIRTFFLTLVEALKTGAPAGKAIMNIEIPKDVDDLPYIMPADEEVRSLIKKIETISRSPLRRPVVVLNPNQEDLLSIRRWPEENFVELGCAIVGEFKDASLVIVGTSREREKACLLASKIPNAVSLAGETSLRDLLTLFCISDALVSSDSGSAHFASLTPIRSVVLFGPETPVLYGPIAKEARIIYRHLACSPCIDVYNFKRSSCRNTACLKQISVKEVFEETKAILKNAYCASLQSI